jgi:hypothetical protein
MFQKDVGDFGVAETRDVHQRCVSGSVHRVDVGPARGEKAHAVDESLGRQKVKHRFIVNPARVQQVGTISQHRVRARRVSNDRIDEGANELPREAVHAASLSGNQQSGWSAQVAD